MIRSDQIRYDYLIDAIGWKLSLSQSPIMSMTLCLIYRLMLLDESWANHIGWANLIWSYLIWSSLGKMAWRNWQSVPTPHRVKQRRQRTVTGRAAATARRHTSSQRHLSLAGTEQLASTCLVSRVDSAHHLHGVGEMSISLQETGEKQVLIVWSTIKLLPNGATQDDDNHAGRHPMNLSPYACSGLTTRKKNRTEKK